MRGSSLESFLPQQRGQVGSRGEPGKHRLPGCSLAPRAISGQDPPHGAGSWHQRWVWVQSQGKTPSEKMPVHMCLVLHLPALLRDSLWTSGPTQPAGSERCGVTGTPTLLEHAGDTGLVVVSWRGGAEPVPEKGQGDNATPTPPNPGFRAERASAGPLYRSS